MKTVHSLLHEMQHFDKKSLCRPTNYNTIDLLTYGVDPGGARRGIARAIKNIAARLFRKIRKYVVCLTSRLTMSGAKINDDYCIF